MLVQQTYERIAQNILGKFWIGQETSLLLFFASWLCRGHVLLEGPPGTGKTLAAKLMSHVLSKTFLRIQFTSDLMPADILGANIYTPGKEGYQFIPGPIFTDCVLADEINRTPPRTQSALLEAMEERQVSIEGKRMPLSPDFFVVATQNPQEFEGTFALPEAQVDRFLIKLVVTHNDSSADFEIIKGHFTGRLPPDLKSLPSIPIDRKAIDAELATVRVDDSLIRYISKIVTATRNHASLSSGSSVRGALAIAKTAQALSAIQGRTFVTADDVKAMTLPCLRHRIRLSPESIMSGESDISVIQSILAKIEFPK